MKEITEKETLKSRKKYHLKKHLKGFHTPIIERNYTYEERLYYLIEFDYKFLKNFQTTNYLGEEDNYGKNIMFIKRNDRTKYFKDKFRLEDIKNAYINLEKKKYLNKDKIKIKVMRLRDYELINKKGIVRFKEED